MILCKKSKWDIFFRHKGSYTHCLLERNQYWFPFLLNILAGEIICECKKKYWWGFLPPKVLVIKKSLRPLYGHEVVKVLTATVLNNNKKIWHISRRSIFTVLTSACWKNIIICDKITASITEIFILVLYFETRF